MVLGRKTNFFLGKKWFGVKNQLFPRENKNTHKKKYLLRHYAARLQKHVFFGFPKKKLVFLPKTIFFLRKELVFHSKTFFS